MGKLPSRNPACLAPYGLPCVSASSIPILSRELCAYNAASLVCTIAHDAVEEASKPEPESPPAALLTGFQDPACASIVL